jgi:hypothetical protein
VVWALGAGQAAALQAQDEPVRTSTHGTFTQVFVGANDTAPVYDGLGTSGFSYGDSSGNSAWAPSTLYFAGAFDYGSGADFRDYYNPPAPFFLGTLYVHNGTISTTSGVSALTLTLETTLTAPVNPAGDGFGFLNQLIYITNTSNSHADPMENADYITFAGLGLSAHVLEGADAAFNLYGTLNSPLTIQNVVSLDPTGFVDNARPENLNITALAVPEPSTWILSFLGMGTVGALLRSRRRLAIAAA